MTTKEAFIKMISNRGVYKTLGVDRSTVSVWKLSIAGKIDRQPPTTDKMEEMLLRYGATIVTEKIWKL